MYWTVFIVLLLSWLLGVVTWNPFGGFIHLLLFLAIALVLFRVVTSRPV